MNDNCFEVIPPLWSAVAKKRTMCIPRFEDKDAGLGVDTCTYCTSSSLLRSSIYYRTHSSMAQSSINTRVTRLIWCTQQSSQAIHLISRWINTRKKSNASPSKSKHSTTRKKNSVSTMAQPTPHDAPSIRHPTSSTPVLSAT